MSWLIYCESKTYVQNFKLPRNNSYYWQHNFQNNHNFKIETFVMSKYFNTKRLMHYEF